MIERLRRLLRGDGLHNALARGSLAAFLIQGAGAGLFLLADVVAARLLGVEQYGVYALVVVWCYILALAGTLGFNNALLKFVPTCLERTAWGELRGLLRFSALATLAAAVLLALLVWLVLQLLDSGDPRIALAFVPALLALPFQILSTLRQAVLRGLGRIAQALAPEYLIRPVAFILLMGMATAVFGPAPQAEQALYLNLVAVALAFGIGTVLQLRHLPAETRQHAPVYLGREWLGTALPLLVIAGLNLISSRLDTVMLGWLADVRDVGIYAAASRVADVIIFGLVSANAVVAPMISRLHAAGRHDELQRMIGLAARGIFFFSLPVAALIVVFGRDILRLFGPEFAAGYPVLVILVCGQLVNALAGPVGFLMTMTGHHQRALRLVGQTALLNLALNFVLIPLFGMLGAAVSSAVCIALRNLLMWRFVRAELALEPSALRLPGKPS